MGENKLLSIVICTHNRANLTRDAIVSVLAQDFPKSKYELLIVDNASTDHTRKMALEFFEAYPNVLYVFECNVGLSYARNRGWQEARGKYIGYLDDDAKASKEWLKVAAKISRTIKPAAFGGPTFAFYNNPKPMWFKDEYESYTLGNNTRPISNEEFIIGGNMFIRRDLLKSLGGFNPQLGMAGKKIAYCEEIDFFIRLRRWLPAAVLYYDPDLFIHHLVRKEKMELRNFPKRCFVESVYFYRVFKQINQKKEEYSLTKFPYVILLVFKEISHIAIVLLKIIKTCSWGLATRDRKKYRYPENYIYEQLSGLIVEFGSRFEAVRQLLVSDK